MATKNKLWNPTKVGTVNKQKTTLDSVKKKQDAENAVKQEKAREVLTREFSKIKAPTTKKVATAKGAWTQAEKEQVVKQRRAAAQAQGKGNWNAEAEMKKRREAATGRVSYAKIVKKKGK